MPRAESICKLTRAPMSRTTGSRPTGARWCRCGVTVRTGFVGEPNLCSGALGAGQKTRQDFARPNLHRASHLLPCALQGTLRTRTQDVHDLAQSGQGLFNLQLALNQKPNQPKRPQANIKIQLVMAVPTYPKRDSAYLIFIKLWWPPGGRVGNESNVPMIDKGRSPLKDSTRRNATKRDETRRNATKREIYPQSHQQAYRSCALRHPTLDWLPALCGS